MYKKVFYLFAFIILSSHHISAQVTYAEDIAQIIYNKCSSCHREGEIGPMALTNYDEVKSWSETIKYVTENRIMPPWQADPEFASYLGENYLSQQEITSIKEWIEAGTPRGNISQEPEFPDFPKGSVLGEPDLILEMSEFWVHKGTDQDDYRYFVLPTNLTEDKVVKAVEFRPGNSKIVHHALLFEDTKGEAAKKDQETPEYGFDGFGSFLGGSQAEILNQKQFPGYVPGEKPVPYPDGIGQKLHAGADIVAQIHYAPWPINDSDKSSINIFFMDENEELERELESHIVVPLPSVINEAFAIFPNTKKTFHGKYTVTRDVSLVNITPHMHLLGKSWEVWLEKPSGDTVNLIRIPDWDFNWQGSYYFDRFIVAPAGSVIHAKATYDNTSNNPNNPANPPTFVTWGEGTTDEMYYLPIGFVPYEEGDENISFTDDQTLDIDEVIKSDYSLFPIRPNPIDNFTVIGFNIRTGQSISLSIFDINGKKIRDVKSNEFFHQGTHYVTLSTINLASGTYTLTLTSQEFKTSQKFIKK